MSRIWIPFRPPGRLTLAIVGPAVAVAVFSAAAFPAAASFAAASSAPASSSAASSSASVGGRSQVRLATEVGHLISGNPRQYARSRARRMLSHFGWTQRQFGPLDKLWNRESGWNKYARNPSSGAYGIPQALPGNKMASAGPRWRRNAATQIRWGLGYIRARYASPRHAWRHEARYGWY
jgi:hypothetical protein